MAMTKNNSEIVLYQTSIKSTTLTLFEESKKEPVRQARNSPAKKEVTNTQQPFPLFYEIKIRGRKYDLF
jgi:hypothetical protein